MQAAPIRTPANARHPGPGWRLPVIVGGVTLAHMALLLAAPDVRSSHASTALPAAWQFSTYTVPSHPAPAPAEVRVPSRTPAAQRTRPTPVALAPEVAQSRQRELPPAPVNSVQSAINSEAVQPAADAAVPQAPVDRSQDLQLASAAPTPANSPTRSEGRSTTDSTASARVVLPPPARLLYDVKGEVKGFPYQVNGELLWAQDGKTYDARLEIRHFLLGSRVQTSTGTLGPRGLEPTRFGDKVKSEVAAHFERDKNKVSFSANTPDVPLLPGAQDQLSVLVQVASLVAAQADQLGAGTVFPFQAIGPRSAETWRFTVGASETLTLPGGAVAALRVWRDPVSEFEPKLEIWLAPDVGYLPVRIRLTQRNGDFVDQLWRETRKP